MRKVTTNIKIVCEYEDEVIKNADLKKYINETKQTIKSESDEDAKVFVEVEVE